MRLLLFFVFIYCKLCSCLPNFVILLADDLGIGDVGCFGNDTIKTPNIDYLAETGIKLNHHLAAAAVCTPSRAALLTGRYPVRSGMESSGRNKVFFFVAASGGLPPNETTIAVSLKQKRYDTALIGKWHLGNDKSHIGDLVHHPLNHGFDTFYGLPLSNFQDFGDEDHSVITSYTPHFYAYLLAVVICGLTASIKAHAQHKKTAFFILLLTVIFPICVYLFLRNLQVINGVLMRNREVVEQPLRLVGLTQRFVEEANSFMGNSLRKKKPFFLFLSFVHVHTALFTTKEFRGKSVHGRYGDNVEEMDWAVGEIISTLKKADVFEDTFVYFSSDNGGHVEELGMNGQREGGHNGIFRGGKTMAGFEGGIRVPSIISWPRQSAIKREIVAPTSQMDIFPTILDVAGIPLADDRVIDGKSLMPLLSNQTKIHHNILFHYCGVNIHAATYIPENENMVWKIHWTTPRFQPNSTNCGYVCHCDGKFVVHHDPPLLFNLSEDPSEETVLDVAADAKYQHLIAEVNKMKSQHEDTIQKVPDQFSFSNTVWKPWLQPCCNFPKCFCRDHKYSDYL